MTYRISISLTVLFFFSVGLISAQETGTTTVVNKDKIKPLWGGYIGVGMGVLSGNLAENFNNPFLLPITLDMAYKNLVAQINLDGAFGKVSKTMTFTDGTSWDAGDKAFYNAIGANVGYSVLNKTKLRVTPTVGYAYSFISKKWWGSSDISQNEPNINSLNLSLLIDYKLKKRGANVIDKHAGYTGIRFTFGAYVPMRDTQPYPEYYNGTMVYFSVGVPTLDLWKNKAKK